MEETRSIARGAAVYLSGSIIGAFLSLLAKIIVVRILSPFQFGVLTLGLTIVSIASKVGGLGLPNGVARQASYAKGRGEEGRAKSFITSAFVLSVISGVIAGLAVNLIPFSKVFHSPDLRGVMHVLSISIPFMVVLATVVSIFRIYGVTRVKVLLSDAIPNGVRFAIVAMIALLGIADVERVAWAYTIPYVISGAVCIALISKQGLSFDDFKDVTIALLAFSIPLLLQSILGMIMNWTDVILIGYYLTARDVGLYSSASVLARAMLWIITAFNFLYLPTVSSMYAERRVEEISKVYYVVTKWMTVIAIPYFLTVFMFPLTTIKFLFGSKYEGAAVALRLLSLTFFVHILFGPNGMTLISFGRTRFVTLTSLLGTVANVVLNVFLIPTYGIAGASVALALAYVIVNAVLSVKLYSEYGVHPFKPNFLKPVTLTMVASTLVMHWMPRGINPAIPLTIATLIAIASLPLTKSVEKEDLDLIRSFKLK